MSILLHPEWATIRTYLRVEAYDRDTNSHGDVRQRIEVEIPASAAERIWLLQIWTPCARCAQMMHPIRERETWGTWYYAAACPLDEKPSCSRSIDAANAYRDILMDLKNAPPEPAQPNLF